MKINKKAITLAELLIVIILIALLLTMASSFNFNKKTSIEKRDGFINRIVSSIKTNYANSLAGKGISTGSSIQVVDYYYIKFSSGTINSFAVQGSNTYTGEQLNYPFFGDKGYEIKDMEYGKKDCTNSPALCTTGSLNDIFDIIFKNGDITYSGTNLDGAVLINFKAGYKGDFKNISLDKRTGRIDVR